MPRWAEPENQLDKDNDNLGVVCACFMQCLLESVGVMSRFMIQGGDPTGERCPTITLESSYGPAGHCCGIALQWP